MRIAIFYIICCIGNMTLPCRGQGRPWIFPACARAGGHAAFAAWMDPDEDVTFLQQCMSLIDAYKRMLAANSMLTPLTKDFEPGQGKIAAVLTIEGGEAIEERLENLRLFHELGVKAMTLTWNDQTSLQAPQWREGIRD